MTRTWTEGDAVAVRNYVDEPWRVGTITGFTPAGWLMIRLGAAGIVDIRHTDDVRVVHEHQVPADEQHWLTVQERDELVRQQAARQFRAVYDALPAVCSLYRQALDGLANELADLRAPRDACAPIARALLAPANEPARTP